MGADRSLWISCNRFIDLYTSIFARLYLDIILGQGLVSKMNCKLNELRHVLPFYDSEVQCIQSRHCISSSSLLLFQSKLVRNGPPTHLIFHPFKLLNSRVGHSASSTDIVLPRDKSCFPKENEQLKAASHDQSYSAMKRVGSISAASHAPFGLFI